MRPTPERYRDTVHSRGLGANLAVVRDQVQHCRPWRQASRRPILLFKPMRGRARCRRAAPSLRERAMAHRAIWKAPGDAAWLSLTSGPREASRTRRFAFRVEDNDLPQRVDAALASYLGRRARGTHDPVRLFPGHMRRNADNEKQHAFRMAEVDGRSSAASSAHPVRRLISAPGGRELVDLADHRVADEAHAGERSARPPQARRRRRRPRPRPE